MKLLISILDTMLLTAYLANLNRFFCFLETHDCIIFEKQTNQQENFNGQYCFSVTQ